MNPFLDEGAPTSTGGVDNAAELCSRLQIEFSLKPPRAIYHHGWGINCTDSRPIIASWYLTVFDLNHKPTTLVFDLVNGSSPLIIGLDVKRYSNTINMEYPSSIVFMRPTDNGERKFITYISRDSNGNDRIHLDIGPHSKSTVATLMSNIVRNKDINLVKKIHRYTHASIEDMKGMLADANSLTPGLERACEKIFSSCTICASSGRPVERKKISLTHINREFNDEVQADFLVSYIENDKYEILNIVDMGTSYGERQIVVSRTANSLMENFESEWICRHGSPKQFSADPEFCKPFFKNFLKGNDIKLNPRPSRSSHKNGKVERNNGVFKSIFSKLVREKTSASPRTLVARASFITNLLHGRSTLSAFQLVRGYSPSVVGLKGKGVTEEMMGTHINVSANRALQKVSRARQTNVITCDMLKKGDSIFVYYNTSKQNERTRWISATVEEPERYGVKCRRSTKGPPMFVSYEHVRLAPQGPLAKDLMVKSLEDELTNLEQEGREGSRGCNIDKDIFGDENEEPADCEELTSYRELSTMAATSKEDPVRDIGESALQSMKTPSGKIQSNEQEVLNEMHKILGSTQVNRKKMEFAPAWIIEKAVHEEINNNWKDAVTEVEESVVPSGANVIGSHFVFKVKSEEKGKKRLKARLCPHGNRDKMRNSVRKDSSTAQFSVIRLLLCLATLLNFRLGCIDIKGAYLQSGPITRTIYVRPPRELNIMRGILWLLTKLPYGITEAGRQWAKAIEDWLLNVMGFERVMGVSQIYSLRDKNRKIVLLLAKVTDDLLLAGEIPAMNEFAECIKKKFKVSKTIIDESIIFNGGEISQNRRGDVKLSMESYLSNIKPIQVSLSRKKETESKAKDTDISAYRTLAGELIWLGSGALPQASYVGSLMQQKVPSLRVSDLLDANGMLKELRQLEPIIMYPRYDGELQDVFVKTFSDASYSNGTGNGYGQTGIICGIQVIASANETPIYHMIDWMSSKQRRVSYSAYGAEILACTDADDRGFYIKTALQSMFPKVKIAHTLLVDSKGLYDTVTTLHEGHDYRLRQTVQRIRDSFESQELDELSWIQAIANIADALTKRNPHSHKLLNIIARQGFLNLPHHNTYRIRSRDWN